MYILMILFFFSIDDYDNDTYFYTSMYSRPQCSEQQHCVACIGSLTDNKPNCRAYRRRDNFAHGGVRMPFEGETSCMNRFPDWDKIPLLCGALCGVKRRKLRGDGADCPVFLFFTGERESELAPCGDSLRDGTGAGAEHLFQSSAFI